MHIKFFEIQICSICVDQLENGSKIEDETLKNILVHRLRPKRATRRPGTDIDTSTSSDHNFVKSK